MAIFYRFNTVLKSMILFLSSLKCSLSKEVLNKPSNSAMGITLKINGGTSIFNGVQALSIKNLFHFSFTNIKPSKWLRILSF